jgi:hypothetical protein
MKHPEARVKTQPHIAISTFKSYQVNMKHHFELQALTSFPGLFFAEHTPLLFVFQDEANDHYSALQSSWWKELFFPVG